MINTESGLTVEGIRARLDVRVISLYKIAKAIDEPESTIYNIFSAHSKYTRTPEVLEKISLYLDSLDRKEQKSKVNIKIPSMEDCPEIFDNCELYTRLFEIGLNSNKFMPDEKLHFAIWHKVLKQFQEKQNPKEI